MPLPTLDLRPLSSAPPPAAGELHLTRRPDLKHRADRARLALELGAAAFVAGEGPVSTIVVPCDSTRPNLDDMLAAAILRRSVAGEALPPAIGRFAEYAALEREGLNAGKLPLDESILGVYRAVLGEAEDRLPTSAADRARFLDRWGKLEEVLFRAAEAGTDPFTTTVFRSDDGFEREMTFLRRDREVFEQDVRRGERWRVTLPGAPQDSWALVLRNPRSHCFPEWSRAGDAAEPGQPYLLLCVDWLDGKWVFSTDPPQRLLLGGLRAALQTAEEAARADRPAPQWELRHSDTMVAAPTRRTALGDAAVLEVVRVWAHGRPVRRARRLPLGIAAAVAAAAVGTWFVARGDDRTEPTRPSDRDPPLVAREIGEERLGDEIRLSLADVRKQGYTATHAPGFALLIAVGKPIGENPALDAAPRDAARLHTLLRDRYGFAAENMLLLTDRPDDAVDDAGNVVAAAAGEPTKQRVLDAFTDIEARTKRYPAACRPRFVLYFAGHGDSQEHRARIGYLVLSGYDPARPEATGIEMTDLRRLARNHVHATHQLFLTDCCFSGHTVTARGDEPIDPTPIFETWGRDAEVWIAAGKADQVAWEDDQRQSSLFARALFEAIGQEPAADRATGNGDGIVADSELAAYLRRRVSELARDHGKKLTPVWSFDLAPRPPEMGQFLLIPKDHAVHRPR